MEWNFVSSEQLKKNLAQTILDIVRANIDPRFLSRLGNNKEEICDTIKGMALLYSVIVDDMKRQEEKDAADT